VVCSFKEEEEAALISHLLMTYLARTIMQPISDADSRMTDLAAIGKPYMPTPCSSPRVCRTAYGGAAERMEVVRTAVQDELHAGHAAVVCEQRILAGELVDPVRMVPMISGSLIDCS
jgi:hypothetical protein